MTSHQFKRGLVAAGSTMLTLTFAFALAGCGGGGGSDDAANQPAPQTFNGLDFTLYQQGPIFTCIRSEGDATTGVETGAVEMRAATLRTILVDSNGQTNSLRPSSSISGARYTYIRTGPESGTLTIEGAGNGSSLVSTTGGILNFSSNYLGVTAAPEFKRTYYLVFGTDNTSITGISTNDVGEIDGSSFLIPYPGILWTQSSLRLYGSGAAVPVGWDLAKSQGLDLPKLFPEGVNLQRLEITPTNIAEPPVGYQFLNSSYTRFSTAVGDFIEEGVGNKDLPPDPTLTIINFDYQPEPTTINRARIRIYEGSTPVVEYNMTFLDKEKGTYVRENGSTGTFEFPFLD